VDLLKITWVKGMNNDRELTEYVFSKIFRRNEGEYLEYLYYKSRKKIRKMTLNFTLEKVSPKNEGLKTVKKSDNLEHGTLFSIRLEVSV